ncbi:hypothetical protein Tco_0221269 [Tanacetum coccineum]
MELIVMDEHNTKMLKTVRMALVNQFKDRLKEGSVVTLERYSLEEIQPRGNELKCTLWSAFAQQFNDFLNTCSDHGKIIVVLQLAMMKIWDDSLLIASYYNQLWKNMKIRHHGYHATKLFFFDGTQPIVKEEFQVVIEGVTSIIVGTIIAIHEEEGWWYIGYRSCRKKAIRSQDMIDFKVDMPKKSASSKDDWVVHKVQCRSKHQNHDKTGTMSLTLWNDEVQDVVNRWILKQQVTYFRNLTPLVLDLESRWRGNTGNPTLFLDINRGA